MNPLRPSGSELRACLDVALGPLYHIEREVRRAGDCRRFVAVELAMGPDALVTVLPTEVAPVVDAERLEREVQLGSGQLRHPNIVPLLSAGAAGPYLYYVRPFVAGTTLRAHLDKLGELPLHHVVRILRDVLHALAHGHARNIHHGNLRPDNVVLTERHTQVAEFGLTGAIVAAARPEREQTLGLALADPDYVSPERRAGDGLPSAGDDVYAVGGIGWEMLTGERPRWAGDGLGDPAALRARRDTIPTRLGQAVMRCLASDPADRWAEPQEMLAELDRLTGA